MLQPFVPFKPAYIERLQTLKKTWVVSQTYKRASVNKNGVQSTGLLLTDYDDPGLGKTHLNAVKTDKLAFLLDFTNEVHAKKVIELIEGSKYNVFWSVVEDAGALKKIVDHKFKDNIRRYLAANTNWRIGSDDRIRPQLQVIFGELFMTLKRGNQTLRCKFEEIENA